MVDGKELAWQATAAANILDAKRKNGRLGGRKSRGGCLSCKSRHVKCDEKKPECQNCMLLGRKCLGYVTVPSKGKNGNSLIGMQLSRSLGLNEADRRTFDYFLSWTAPRIASVLDRDFWCGRVLQLAQAEPMVMHSLLALSTFYEHPQYMTGYSPELWLRENNASNIARSHYSFAIRSFSARMNAGTVTPLLAILSCVLFTCIEVIRDNAFEALRLLAKGVQMLRHLQLPVPDSEKSTFILLKRMLGRVGVSAAMFGQVNPTEVVPVESPIARGGSAGFSDLEEARSQLFDILAAVHSFIRDATGYRASIGVDPLPSGSTAFDTGVVEADISFINGEYESMTTNSNSDLTNINRNLPLAQLQQIQAQLQERLAWWFDKFRWEKTCDPAAANLIMHYNMATVLVGTRLNAYQTIFDQYTHQFQEMVRMADVYVKIMPDKTTFVFEDGIIGVLYFAATKCRVPSIRRKALEILRKAPRKECIWSAQSAMESCSLIVALEEQSLASSTAAPGIPVPFIPDAMMPPEEDRIHSIEVVPALPFKLRVTRYSVDPLGNRIKSVEIHTLRYSTPLK